MTGTLPLSGERRPLMITAWLVSFHARKQPPLSSNAGSFVGSAAILGFHTTQVLPQATHAAKEFMLGVWTHALILGKNCSAHH